jgi:adenine specific DNA methylase Mod
MNKLYFGDNLDMLREKIKDESVDLVYLDPPFKSNANYNVLFKPGGVVSEAQAEAFRDTWEWGRRTTQAPPARRIFSQSASAAAREGAGART